MRSPRQLGCKAKSQASPSGSRRRRGLQLWALVGLEARQLLSATVYVVTDTSDNSDDSNSLAGALSAANANTNTDGSVIEFNLGSSPATIGVTTPLVVNPTEQLTIEGPGAGQLTITANDSCTVFECEGGSTTISGLTITGGNAEPGLSNLIASGGGVLNEVPSTLDLEQCTISGCSAYNAGGGIANLGTITVNGCTIQQNSCTSNGGGLINALSASATIEGGCAFTGNSAANGGGLDNVSTVKFGVFGCTISGNTAADNGGGLYNDGGTATVSGCTVSSNSAQLGGGIENSNTGSATLEYGCTIKGNSANNGGGLSNAGTTFAVNSCTVSGNTAANNGGGLYNSGTTAEYGCTINGNSAQTGGGIDNTGTATVSSCTVSGNSAQNGGGIDNTSTGSAEVSGCAIGGNTAGTDGGGFVNSGQAQISTCTISGNSATSSGTNNGEGGGMFVWTSQSTTLTECTISGNSAQVGSGLFVGANNTGQVSLTHCTVADNSASAGPGLWAHLAPVSLTDTIVADNSGYQGATSDIVGTEVTGSYDLIGTGGSGAISNGSSGNIVLTSLTDLGLAPLNTYKELTILGAPAITTMALLPGSPALGTGSAIRGITTDERGAPIGASVDIGAFQSQGFTLAIQGGSPQSAAVGTAFTQPLAVTVTATDPWEPVAEGVVTFAATPGSSGASANLSPATAVIGASGVASVTATANSTLGSYTVSASAAGAAAAVNFDLTNLKLATVSVSISAASPMYGQPVTLAATVTGAGTPTGTVTFLEGGTKLRTVALNGSGQATLTVSDLPAGAGAITADYSGDASFGSQTSAPASVTVTRDVNRVVLASRRVFKKRKEVAIDLVAEIVPEYPGAVAPTGTVGYLIRKKSLGTATVMDGKATLVVKPTVLPKRVTAVYSGDVDYTPSTSALTVKKPKAALVRHAAVKRA